MQPVIFKMPFIRRNAQGIDCDGVSAIISHTMWHHAEKDLLRMCKKIPGFQFHGETTVAGRNEFKNVLSDSEECLVAYLEYQDDEGNKVTWTGSPNEYLVNQSHAEHLEAQDASAAPLIEKTDVADEALDSATTDAVVQQPQTDEAVPANTAVEQAAAMAEPQSAKIALPVNKPSSGTDQTMDFAMDFIVSSRHSMIDALLDVDGEKLSKEDTQFIASMAFKGHKGGLHLLDKTQSLRLETLHQKLVVDALEPEALHQKLAADAVDATPDRKPSMKM